MAFGRHEREPQAAVGGEALLRREVVDVGLRRRRPAGRLRREVASKSISASASAPATRVRRDRDAGGGLVVRGGVRRRCRPRRRRSARSPGSDCDDRSGSPRNGASLTALANFEPNSPKDEELRAVADQAEGGDLPERRRAAVAEHDLVVVGQREQVAQPGAHAADLGLDRLLPVRGAEVGAARLRRAPRPARGAPCDGPAPKRPSAGSRSAGMVMLGSTGSWWRRFPGCGANAIDAGHGSVTAADRSELRRVSVYVRGRRPRRPSRGPARACAGAGPT